MPNLIGIVRELLASSGLPYVIENVVGSPLENPIMLCGSMFKLRCPEGYLQRHRLFELSFPVDPPPPCDHFGRSIGVYGHGSGGGWRQGRTANAELARLLMDMPWSNRVGISQAIPPAYTHWIGKQLIPLLP